ncbi:hypothetical protein EDEG_01452 [Edhazardia aedis USNM 41457]|uniref:Uncharacterized protein n=1 Tax=Edhazardia aedis (strain USNM 41457) TaxID=1003232 RepID=J9DP06_EDHAE|nr:hypothetical protein EDEG_01452 [Edhazardia aedis USNM 41457]|eukprot:EJW04280.1 hypothetical protein EDEG_01452 [Edhazardia aedis USNM 41457]
MGQNQETHCEQTTFGVKFENDVMHLLTPTKETHAWTIMNEIEDLESVNRNLKMLSAKLKKASSRMGTSKIGTPTNLYNFDFTETVSNTDFDIHRKGNVYEVRNVGPLSLPESCSDDDKDFLVRGEKEDFCDITSSRNSRKKMAKKSLKDESKNALREKENGLGDLSPQYSNENNPETMKIKSDVFLKENVCEKNNLLQAKIKKDANGNVCEEKMAELMIDLYSPVNSSVGKANLSAKKDSETVMFNKSCKTEQNVVNGENSESTEVDDLFEQFRSSSKQLQKKEPSVYTQKSENSDTMAPSNLNIPGFENDFLQKKVETKKSELSQIKKTIDINNSEKIIEKGYRDRMKVGKYKIASDGAVCEKKEGQFSADIQTKSESRKGSLDDKILEKIQYKSFIFMKKGYKRSLSDTSTVERAVRVFLNESRVSNKVLQKIYIKESENAREFRRTFYKKTFDESEMLLDKQNRHFINSIDSHIDNFSKTCKNKIENRGSQKNKSPYAYSKLIPVDEISFRTGLFPQLNNNSRNINKNDYNTSSTCRVSPLKNIENSNKSNSNTGRSKEIINFDATAKKFKFVDETENTHRFSAKILIDDEIAPNQKLNETSSKNSRNASEQKAATKESALEKQIKERKLREKRKTDEKERKRLEDLAKSKELFYSTIASYSPKSDKIVSEASFNSNSQLNSHNKRDSSANDSKKGRGKGKSKALSNVNDKLDDEILKDFFFAPEEIADILQQMKKEKNKFIIF